MLSALNETIKQVAGNQTLLKANTSDAIAANKFSISANSRNISINTHRFSTLAVYPCNCTSEKEGYYCIYPLVYVGSIIGLNQGTVTPVCCNLCLNETEEDALAKTPAPLAVGKKSSKKTLLDSL